MKQDDVHFVTDDPKCWWCGKPLVIKIKGAYRCPKCKKLICSTGCFNDHICEDNHEKSKDN